MRKRERTRKGGVRGCNILEKGLQIFFFRLRNKGIPPPHPHATYQDGYTGSPGTTHLMDRIFLEQV